MKREDIVTAARGWLGTRWKHQAALKGIGADCIGLIEGVAAECGVKESAAWAKHPAHGSYGREPDTGMLLAACAAYLEPVRGYPQLGDVLLFRIHDKPQHFGIVSGNDYMIHAYAQARRVVEHRIDEQWRSRIVGVYRFRGLNG